MYYPKNPDELKCYTNTYTPKTKYHKNILKQRYYAYDNIISLIGDNLYHLYRWCLTRKEHQLDSVELIGVVLVFHGKKFLRVQIKFKDKAKNEWYLCVYRDTMEREFENKTLNTSTS